MQTELTLTRWFEELILNYDGTGTRCSHLASKVLDKIHNTVAVAIFIIIPRKKDRQNFENDFADLAYE